MLSVEIAATVATCNGRSGGIVAEYYGGVIKSVDDRAARL